MLAGKLGKKETTTNKQTDRQTMHFENMNAQWGVGEARGK